MPNFAVVDVTSGKICNRIVLAQTDVWAPPTGMIAIQENDQIYEIGGAYLNGVYTPPTIMEQEHQITVVPPISDRQFFQKLALEGIIGENEAEAAVATGTIPQALLALIGNLPEDQRFNARMMLKGATIFERSHPLTRTIGQLYGLDEVQLTEFFLEAAQL